MKALRVERSLPRFAAARVAAALPASLPAPGAAWSGDPARPARPAVTVRLADVDPPEPPAAGWRTIRPRLAGICGSDLATVTGKSSRWFEPIVSFPFVPGHEVVADTDDGGRVVVEPVLHCALRGIDPPCPACASGATNHCERLSAGHLSAGLQTGFCRDTGGGWSLAMTAHDLQLHPVPEEWSDEAAVMVEPTACAVHAALLPPPASHPAVAVVIGSGTIGLATVAALKALRSDIEHLVAAARYPEQRSMADRFGADSVVEPGEVRRAVRRITGSFMLDGGQLAGGADLVFDCAGNAGSIADALAVVRPGGTVVLVGMPGRVAVDLTPLWQREVSLVGAYAYGPEPTHGGRHSFDLAMELVDAAGLERLVSACYTLDRYGDAIEHASSAGPRGATKIVFDMRGERRR